MNATDHEILFFLNQLVGGTSSAFNLALVLCGRAPLAICVMVLLALWWTHVNGRKPVRALPGAVSKQLGFLESRRRTVALVASVAGAFVATRLIAFGVDLPRPLVREELQVPIEPALWDDIVRGMTGFGAFPSDHAALFFAVATGLFAWSRAAGCVGLAVATAFSLARVAVGFHYPSDMLAGGVIGAVAATIGQALTPRLRMPLDLVVDLFERFPALMYPLLFVAALDFVHHFQMLVGTAFTLMYNLLDLAGVA